MDGNGRWAQQRLIPRFQGHRNAVRAVRTAVETAAELGLQALTLYAFSTENWVRPHQEINVLMELLHEYLQKELGTMLENNVSMRISGDSTRLPEFLHKPLEDALKLTERNTGLTLNLALNYGGRAELVRAMQQMARRIEGGKLRATEINEEVINQHLYTTGLPDPDLIVRTSGEQRLSNFLIWQAAYAEFYYTEVLWPDFAKEDFLKALQAYQQRQRRMGDVSSVSA
jgi:undecaprenyl diphosphate synthase